jgi:hypothetical protein
MNESVYNLIPEPVIVAARPPRYNSKFNSSAPQPPSYSTFPNKTVVDGPCDGSGAAQFQRPMVPMGKSVAAEIDPAQFLKKGEGVRLQHASTKKERIVRKPTIDNEKPVMGLITEKNFVTSNAVEATAMAPKGRKVPEPRPTDRPSFGKVPKYLDTLKAQMAEEEKFVAGMREKRDQQAADQKAEFVRPMSEEDRQRLVAQLKERWDEKHRQFISQPFARDTMMQIARKEVVEKELKEIEAALEKLSKQVVYVYKDEAPYKEWARSTAMADAQRDAIARSQQRSK